MAEAEKIRRFIRENPALADMPFIVVEGIPMSPREALERLERGEMVAEITRAVATLGSSLTEEQLWLLTEEYYRRLLLKPPPRPVIVWIGGKLTFEQALEEVRLRTPKGQELMKSYDGFLKELTRRIG